MHSCQAREWGSRRVSNCFRLQSRIAQICATTYQVKWTCVLSFQPSISPIALSHLQMLSTVMSYQNKHASSPSDIFISPRDRNLPLACVLFFSPISKPNLSIRHEKAPSTM